MKLLRNLSLIETVLYLENFDKQLHLLREKIRHIIGIKQSALQKD